MMRDYVSNGVILGENDSLMRGIIRSVLLYAEQQVFMAADGLEAVVLARQFKARLVLLDIGMPRLNGLLACEAIRALPGYVDVPIVMLTGYDDERFRKAAQRLGANEFLTKPFRPDVLLARLGAYLDIPAKSLPAAPFFGDDGSAIPGGRVQVWDIHRDPVAVCGDSANLTNGRKMLHVWRNVDGRS